MTGNIGSALQYASKVSVLAQRSILINKLSSSQARKPRFNDFDSNTVMPKKCFVKCIFNVMIRKISKMTN
jgi:hypothetical protein